MALASRDFDRFDGPNNDNRDNVTWDEALRAFLLHIQASRAKKTAKFYDVQLRQLALWCEDNKVGFTGFTKRHLDRYLIYRHEQGLSPNTLKHDAVTTKAFFKWCAHDGLISRSPLAEYQVRDAPTPPRYMPTEEDVRKLLSALTTYWSLQQNPDMKFIPASRRSFFRERNACLVLGLLDTACRIGEMLSLKVEDVRLQERQVLIRESKGREPRALPISAEWAQALAVWLKVRERIMRNAEPGTDEGYVFISEYGGRMDESLFLKTLRRLTAWAQLPTHITLHSLRRYSLNRLAKHNLLGAQAIAGHKNPQTTLLYTKLDAEFMRGVHEGTGVVKTILGTRQESRRKKLV
jgi:integrase/recombinase XerD